MHSFFLIFHLEFTTSFHFVIYCKPIANILLMLKYFRFNFKIRNNMSMYTIVIYIQYGIGKSRLTKTFGLYQSYLKRLILRHALNPQSIIKANLKKKIYGLLCCFSMSRITAEKKYKFFVTHCKTRKRC